MSSAGLQPFLISEFKTGIHSYLEPWIRPQDAFDPLINAYVYRGSLYKRTGYSLFGNQLDDLNPVMGIMRWIDPSGATPKLLTATAKTIANGDGHLYLYDPGPNTFTQVVLPANFTGNISNFFNFTNWQAASGQPAYLYMVNNKDPITLFDGAAATQPTFLTNQNGTAVNITTCLDVQVYKNRLLFIRPTLSTGGVQNQTIYWSKANNPTTILADVAGNGGFLPAATGDTILGTEFIRDVLVVFFTNSTWIFRYTGIDSSPFRWDKVNDSKSINSPYASVAYDERCTAIGGTGLIACDGTNVQRYDVPIIDYYEDNFSEQYYAQAFAQRYDNLNQSWVLYVSNDRDEEDFPLVDGVAPGSDSALIYNFLENTWATYTWSDPLTCLGTFISQTGKTWAALPQSWASTQVSWSSYSNQKSAPILLAGDTTGHVFHMDDESVATDYDPANPSAPFTVVPDIFTTRWNPILSAGQKTQFVYIDIYYGIASTDPNNPISVELNFYVDNSNSIAATRTLTLDGPKDTAFTFKRIYINLIGEFVKMEIDPNKNALMQFLGFILWARPAGRLTP